MDHHTTILFFSQGFTDKRVILKTYLKKHASHNAMLTAMISILLMMIIIMIIIKGRKISNIPNDVCITKGE